MLVILNSRHVDWDDNDNSPDGKYSAGWASINNLAFLYNGKDAVSFYSGHWNIGNNPDLAFASVGPYNRLPDRRVLESFPDHNIELRLSQHKVCFVSAKHAC